VDSDYSDYSFFYDSFYTSPEYIAYCTDSGYCFDWGGQFVDDDGNVINPSQFIHATDGYTMQTHEIRITSPQENRFRLVAGLFWQGFEHEIFQRYQINGLGGYVADGVYSPISVTGWPDTIWLTNQVRNDDETAVFGEMSFDILENLTATAGLRWFQTDNSLRGFFGFNANYSSNYGEALCFSDRQFNGSPCTNLDDKVDESDLIPGGDPEPAAFAPELFAAWVAERPDLWQAISEGIKAAWQQHEPLEVAVNRDAKRC
jgi:outer membrane receptor protein involved in Fe transport